MDVKTLFDRASAWTASVFAGVKADQHGDLTPCAEWDVGTLMNHIVGANAAFAAAAAGEAPGSAPDEMPDFLGDDPVAAFNGTAAAVRAAMDGDGVMEQTMHLSAADLPGSVMFNVAVSETLVHGWDLAKATGQDASFDAGVAQAIYDFTVPGVDFGRQSGFYGPEVPVPDDAPIQHRLLGLLGRQP